MPSMCVATVTLEKKGLVTLGQETKKKALLILDKGAFEIAGEAIKKVRVDTGATKASIYVDGARSPRARYDYNNAMQKATVLAAASGRRPNMHFTDKVAADGEWTRIIGASTWYAEYVEFIHEAFLLPAAQTVQSKLVKMWEDLFRW